MGDMMTFPATVEEFMEQYKMTDTEHVYSNGTEFVPIYRMKQWFEHCRYQQRPTIDAVPVVRCEKCIAYTPVDDNTGKCVFLIGKNQYVVPDGYCYLGERKEGADNG